MAFIRKVKTASGATAVQIAYKQKGRIIKIIHIGSAHTGEELEMLLALARKQMQGNQQELFKETKPSVRVSLKRSYSDLLWKVLQDEYRKLGFDPDRGAQLETGQLASIGRPGGGSDQPQQALSLFGKSSQSGLSETDQSGLF